MALSAIAVAVGAIMYWAVAYQGNGVRVSSVGLLLAIFGILKVVTYAVGLIFMFIGAFGLGISIIICAMSVESGRRHSTGRRITGPGDLSALLAEPGIHSPSNGIEKASDALTT